MRGQSEVAVEMEWQADIVHANKTVSRERETTCYNGSERRDTYRFDLSDSYPIKLTMIIDDIVLKRGIIKDLCAGGLSCDFFEPINLPIGKQVHIRFRLEMDEPAIIKAEAVYIGVKGNGFYDSKINRLDFSETLSESDQDKIHQYILIKQLEMFRNNRRKFDY